jgi:hypothetical protein
LGDKAGSLHRVLLWQGCKARHRLLVGLYKRHSDSHSRNRTNSRWLTSSSRLWLTCWEVCSSRWLGLQWAAVGVVQGRQSQRCGRQANTRRHYVVCPLCAPVQHKAAVAVAAAVAAAAVAAAAAAVAVAFRTCTSTNSSSSQQ